MRRLDAVACALLSRLTDWSSSAMTDFTLTGSGTVYLLTPQTRAAEQWVTAHLPEDALRWGHGIAIEARYIAPIVAGIVGDGLTITT